MPTNQRKAAIAVLAASLAIPAEGLYRIAYYDPPHILSICYGHTGPDIIKDRLYSIGECNALLTKDMQTAVDAVERCTPGLPVKVAAAFSDAVFNIGPKIVCDPSKSTAARLLRAGQYKEACEQLTRWDRSVVAGISVPLPGLTKRRKEEMKVCLEGLK